MHAENPDDIVPSYFVVNAVILCAGIGLNRLGARLRLRRAERHEADRAGLVKDAAEPSSES